MRKRDKDNIVLKEPMKHNDHLMAAMRFGVYGLVSRFGFATSTPSTGSVIHRFRDKPASSVIHRLNGGQKVR